MSESPEHTASQSLHRVISESESVNRMEEQQALSDLPPKAVYIDPNSAVVDDDEAMEDVDDSMAAYDNMDTVPRRLTDFSNRSVSSGSSLSDGSAGIIPDNVLVPVVDTTAIAIIQQSTTEKPKGVSSLLPAGQQDLSGERIVTLSPAKKTMGEPLPIALQRMDSNSSGSMRARSENSSNDWGYGWYEDVHGSDHALTNRSSEKKSKRSGLVSSGREVQDDLLHMLPKDMPDVAAMAVTAPTYVLEESLSSQKLWKYTAGQRPPQPVEERAFYEKMWSQNFARSQVSYSMPVEVLTATSPICLSPFAEGIFDGPNARSDYTSAVGPPTGADQGAVTEAFVSLMNDTNAHNEQDDVLPRTVKGQGGDGDLTILVRGVNAFGTTVSKSFARPAEKGGGIDTINISIASYRVVETKERGKHAQFLVIYREGSIRDTLGVWKRYRDFEKLAQKVTHAHEGCAAVIANVSPLAVTEEAETEHLPNAITSWRLLKKRQRWYRCLDAGYLSLKVFLLERFLHDILFESSSPKLLRDFVGAGTALA